MGEEQERRCQNNALNVLLGAGARARQPRGWPRRHDPEGEQGEEGEGAGVEEELEPLHDAEQDAEGDDPDGAGQSELEEETRDETVREPEDELIGLFLECQQAAQPEIIVRPASSDGESNNGSDESSSANGSSSSSTSSTSSSSSEIDDADEVQQDQGGGQEDGAPRAPVGPVQREAREGLQIWQDPQHPLESFIKHKPNSNDAYVVCTEHRACQRTRTLNPSKRKSGRPFGELSSWVLSASQFADKAAHMSHYPDHASRSAARRLLHCNDDYADWAALEADRGDADSSEPE